MAKPTKMALSNDDLARSAAESTETVRIEAERSGSLLPVLLNGRVVHVEPATGKETNRELSELTK